MDEVDSIGSNRLDVRIPIRLNDDDCDELDDECVAVGLERRR
jgi:hypothetical protein